MDVMMNEWKWWSWTNGCKWIVVHGRIEVEKRFKLACLNRMQNGSKLTCLIVVKII